jgi:hypothetical protein
MMMIAKSMPRTTLPALLLSCWVSSASAQTPPTYDPAQLPAFRGTVLQYDLSSRGEVNGLILEDGLEVHMSIARSAEIAAAVRPGDPVTVHGLKARLINVVRAVSLTDEATSVTVIDAGEKERGDRNGHLGNRHGHRETQDEPSVVHGVVRMTLHDSDGDLDGVLLTDGTIVHVSLQAVKLVASQLVTGATLSIRGSLRVSSVGRLINADAIGPTQSQLTLLPETRR